MRNSTLTTVDPRIPAKSFLHTQITRRNPTKIFPKILEFAPNILRTPIKVIRRIRTTGIPEGTPAAALAEDAKGGCNLFHLKTFIQQARSPDLQLRQKLR